MNENRHLLQYVHGFGARSRPGLEVADEVGVGDERAGDRDAVAVAALDRARDDGGGLEAARDDHGDGDEVLDRARVGEVDPLDVALGVRPCPPPAEDLGERRRAEGEVVAEGVLAAGEDRVVGLDDLRGRELACGVARVREAAARADVQVVDARLLEPAAHLQRLLERVPLGQPRHQLVQLLLGGDLVADAEVRPDRLADRPHHLEPEARAVLERPAVVVGAVVDGGGEELGREHAVRAGDLDAVEPGLLRAARGLREHVDDLGDLLRRHRLAREAVQRLGLAGGGERLVPLEERHDALAAGVDDLEDVGAAGLADALAELPPERDRLVRVDVRVAGDDAAAGVDRRVRGDDRADAAAGEAEVPVGAHLRARAVVVVEPSRHAGAQDAVANGQRPERQRLEDRVRAHLTSAGRGAPS